MLNALLYQGHQQQLGYFTINSSSMCIASCTAAVRPPLELLLVFISYFFGACAGAGIPLQGWIQEPLKDQKVFVQGCDKQGRGFTIIRVARHQPKADKQRNLKPDKLFTCYIMNALVSSISGISLYLLRSNSSSPARCSISVTAQMRLAALPIDCQHHMSVN
jgi:hypothetical protein